MEHIITSNGIDISQGIEMETLDKFNIKTICLHMNGKYTGLFDLDLGKLYFNGLRSSYVIEGTELTLYLEDKE
ncbi:MAG: hypothetical protein U9Q21_03275 [Candidatus Auribacterota bacterium]|nr:hypothetical protein [Candidatus Auribacterota bacterium]